jgi:hypothetical protein
MHRVLRVNAQPTVRFYRVVKCNVAIPVEVGCESQDEIRLRSGEAVRKRRYAAMRRLNDGFGLSWKILPKPYALMADHTSQ